MKNQIKIKLLLFVAIALFAFNSGAFAQIGGWDPTAEEKATKVIESFKISNKNLQSFFASSYGYVVFPSVGKGAMGLGGAHGRGIVFEKGQAVGSARMTQVTWGLQCGGQAYSEVIFFENEAALSSFKTNKFEFSGQASAVAATYGASADIAYKNGVAVYTQTKGGLMYEASLGGQKFKFIPAEVSTHDEEESIESE